MSESPDWLPPLLKLEDHDGDWNRYIDAAFAVFYRDFIVGQPRFRGLRVGLKRGPLYKGKESTFWHCVSEGSVERERLPDLERCKRIAWIKAVIEHADEACVRVWSLKKYREERVYLWLSDEYLVALGARRGYFLLVTAFCTDREDSKQRYSKEYENSQKG